MRDTKILQAILDSQVSIKEDVKGVKEDIKGVKEDIKGVEKRLTQRIDKLGLQIASLEDDTPTIEEFDNLDKRVKKLEKQAASS